VVIYSFTSRKQALEAAAREKIDVFLADNALEVDPKELPAKCGLAYLVDSPEVHLENGVPAICRFQRTELLYKSILGVFSDALGEASVRNLYSGNTKVLMFSSPCGGTGTSTLAAACAAHFALAGKRSLYLSLEDFGSSDLYFSGEGASDMSDVVYAVKRRRGSLPIKLESCVRRDKCGVCYFSTAKVALDMLELSDLDRQELVSVLAESGGYDIIVIDMSFDLRKETRELFRQAHALVWVSDGMAGANLKIARAYKALQVLDQGAQAPLSDRVCLLWNKFVSGGGEDALQDLGIQTAGMVMKVRHRVNEQIAYQLAISKAFDAILDA